MARTPSASSLARQAAMDASVQTWTRCRIPIEEGLPYCVDPARDVLAKAPGYYHTTTGRNIDDLDEVVILSNWVDIASVNAFIASPGYAAYFETLGIEEPTRFHAFFILEPSMIQLPLSGKMTTFTMCFEHPVNQESRTRFNLTRGFSIPHGFRNDTHQAWVSKSQSGPDGQLLDIGVLVQIWPTFAGQLTLDVQNMMSNDQGAREQWKRRVDFINPSEIEEITWDMDHRLLSPKGPLRIGVVFPQRTIRPCVALDI